jgi:hypothetical protein
VAINPGKPFLKQVPVPAGNYGDLSTDGKRLYFMSRPTGRDGTPALKTLAIDNKKPQPETSSRSRARTSCRATARSSCSGRSRTNSATRSRTWT